MVLYYRDSSLIRQSPTLVCVYARVRMYTCVQFIFVMLPNGLSIGM